MKLSFDQFKIAVYKLASKSKISHHIPCGNDLFKLWNSTTPESVVENIVNKTHQLGDDCANHRRCAWKDRPIY